MSERILTLFGEEIVPEQQKAAKKPRAPKSKEEKQVKKQEAPTQKDEEPVVIEESIAEAAPDPVVQVEEKKEETFVLPEDWKGDKKYYAIGEVADLFKVKTSHIRFWTNEFKLKVRTTRKGDRLYTPEQIRELKAIHHLVKERGFKLSGAKAKMKAQNNRDVETIDLKRSLLQLRNKLLTIRNQLT